MRDLSQLLTVHRFPSALDRIRRSFARQPDRQTCGAAAIRHGLLLGGLTLPTATLERVLEIRDHEGTTPAALRTCLRRLGLDVRQVRKPRHQGTADNLAGAALQLKSPLGDRVVVRDSDGATLPFRDVGVTP